MAMERGLSSGRRLFMKWLPDAGDSGIGWVARLRGGQRTTNTGILECVSTFAVSLPSNRLDKPLRPWEAITIRSQRDFFACLMMASYGARLVSATEPHATLAAAASALARSRIFAARFFDSASNCFWKFTTLGA